ncbi:MAG: FlhC family transcriptional regulator, partial [Azoarcus sp.]|nr:FlhC family transcriptional regulator [Azoarcus sp.]
MKNKRIIDEAEDIRRAIEMVQLGARMQMLEAETRLSREKLLKIYKEVRGVSPPKGMLPFSTDWFMT